MARLEKRERQKRRAKVRVRFNLPRIESNLSTPKPEGSNTKTYDLTRNGMNIHFHYPWMKGSSTSRKTVKSTYVKPETGTVGYKLTKRKHKRVIQDFSWKGRFAR